MANLSNKLSQIHITTGSGKMSEIPSINTSSLTNHFCRSLADKPDLVCFKCYSDRLSKLRPSLEKRLLQNSVLLSQKLIPLTELPVLNARFARFSSFGEIINETHFENFINIARRNPYTTFGLWTKRSDIVMKYPKEPNIKYIFSVAKVDGGKPNDSILKYFDKTFTAVSKTKPANCAGSCINCLLCYTDNDVTDIREIIK